MWENPAKPSVLAPVENEVLLRPVCQNVAEMHLANWLILDRAVFCPLFYSISLHKGCQNTNMKVFFFIDGYLKKSK